MWQLRCIATCSYLTPRQSFSALITTPMPSLKSTLSRYPFSSYSVLLLIRYVTLWPWHLTCDLDLLWCRAQTLYQIWFKSSNLRRSYCSFIVWPYDLEYVPRVALLSGIVWTKFKPSRSIRSWNVTIFMLISHVTLWPWPLTRWRWTFVIDLVSRGHSVL